MKNNNNWIWIIVIILALIFIVPNFMKKEYVTSPYFMDITSCENMRKTDTSLCVSSNCIQITQQTAGCSIRPNDNYYIGKYLYLNSDKPCDDPSTKDDNYWQCYYGQATPPPTCNTPADTNCNGCVSDEEFPIALTNWKNLAGGITDEVFPLSLTKWQNREGC